MELLVALVLVVVLVVGAFLVFKWLRNSPTANRAATVITSRLDDPVQSSLRDPTVETLRPGDAISFSNGENCVVVSVVECDERVGARSSGWRWSFLDDQRLLEAAPDGNVLYGQSTVAYQGGELFNRLVADADQGGILKLFEQRVRDGSNARMPVSLEHATQVFDLRSTGTFSGRILGRPLGEVWRDMSSDPDQNVFFEAEAKSGDQLLGIWTSHILLLVGQPLTNTDIDAIYPGAESAR